MRINAGKCFGSPIFIIESVGVHARLPRVASIAGRGSKADGVQGHIFIPGRATIMLVLHIICEIPCFFKVARHHVVNIVEVAGLWECESGQFSRTK